MLARGVRSKVSLFGLRQFLGPFCDLLQSAQMPKATGKNRKQNTPTTSSNQSVAVRHPPGQEQCWCQGFKNGCGCVRSSRVCKYHAAREKRNREKRNREEIQVQLQGDLQRDLINHFNEDKYWNVPGLLLLIVSSDESRLRIIGGSLTEAMSHSMWQCRECGNPNMSQRILMIKIEFILYLLLP